MKLPRRKQHMPREEFLDGLRSLARNVQVEHTMTVRHEPIPKPESAMVVFKREDGSESFRYPVNVGPRALSLVHVPLINIHSGPITPATQITMEFQWNR
jgi:hypothetical protein